MENHLVLFPSLVCKYSFLASVSLPFISQLGKYRAFSSSLCIFGRPVVITMKVPCLTAAICPSRTCLGTQCHQNTRTANLPYLLLSIWPLYHTHSQTHTHTHAHTLMHMNTQPILLEKQSPGVGVH